MILTLCVLACSLSQQNLETTADNVTYQETQSSDIGMSEYQTDQIIWWQYYGEWAATPDESSPKTMEQRVPDGNEATTKKSQGGVSAHRQNRGPNVG